MKKGCSLQKGLAGFVVGMGIFCLGISNPQESTQLDATAEQQVVPGLTVPPTAQDLTKKALYSNIAVSDILALLDDPKNIIHPMFKVPDALKHMVGFWLLIYSKYSMYQTLVYDRTNPSRIFAVIDTLDLFQKGLSPVALEIFSKKKVKETISQFQLAFKNLQKKPRANFNTGSPEAHLLSLYGRLSSRGWKEVEQNMRRQPGQRDRILQGISNADPFFPAMEFIFKKFSLPIELTRIPLVESSFNLNAVSKARAKGTWQFMESSAREFLVVDPIHKIDERLSPIKSAYAAAKMFRRHFKILGDWGLAIISYNHGLRTLIPIAKKYRGDNISKLLTLQKASPLGYASKNYYAEFLAMLIAEGYRDFLYELPKKTYSDTISIVRLKNPTSIFELSSLYNISLYELRLYNPDIFDHLKKLPAGTRIVLPRKTGESLVLAPEQSHGSTGRAPTSAPVEFIEYIH